MTAGEGGSSGAVVVVGVNLDSRSRELLTWALVKVARTGDRVIALHVLDPKADKTRLISLVKTFDYMLGAYEGFCNLKQVDLKLKVCRGSPVHKILPREAENCGTTCLILGTSEKYHKLKSRTSMAKYCAKKLHNNVSVICVDNGKIVFQRKSSDASNSCSLIESGSRLKRRKILAKSPLSQPPSTTSTSSSTNECGAVSMELVAVKTREIHELGRWALLRRLFLQGPKASETSPTKKRSLKQRLLRGPSKQSVASIYPDKKQTTPSDDSECVASSEHEKGAVLPYFGGTNSTVFSEAFKEKLKDIVDKHSTTCHLFDYKELLLATNGFASDNLIGKGGTSRVYRGSLPEKQEAAVKVLKPSEDVVDQFVSEIEIILSLQHRNIISLIGFCSDGGNLLLVYNLLSRGCLEETLHGADNDEIFVSWEDRYKIALGVAEALDYLHSRTEPVIHRDVKSSNILLSDNFEPMLSDFGLATRASSHIHHINMPPDIAGTFGYLAPEYFMDGELDEKIDVYAFGVVLLELLSGRKPIDNGRPKGQESLVIWAKNVTREGKFADLIDPNLITPSDQKQFDAMVLAATLCVRESPQSRPEISVVLKLLKGDQEVTEWAMQEQEAKSFEDSNVIGGEKSTKDIQFLLNLALMNLDDDSASVSSSIEQNVSVEDYLGGRYSRCSSFD